MSWTKPIETLLTIEKDSTKLSLKSSINMKKNKKTLSTMSCPSMNKWKKHLKIIWKRYRPFKGSLTKWNNNNTVALNNHLHYSLTFDGYYLLTDTNKLSLKQFLYLLIVNIFIWFIYISLLFSFIGFISISNLNKN